jgi:hypothetical protein
VPMLQVNLSDPGDVQAALTILARHLPTSAQAACCATAQQPLAQAMEQMKLKKIWRFLERVANLEVREYSLPELGTHLGMSSNKIGSLKAILAKPEQRLGVQFFELVTSGAVDASGNPRYRMPDTIRHAIHQTA